MLDLATNYNFLGPPEGLKELVSDDLDHLIGDYPDAFSLPVKEASAHYFDVPPSNVAAGAGSTELLFSLPNLLPHARAIMYRPTFWEYPEANRRSGRDVIEIELLPEDDFGFDLSALEVMLRKGPAAVYLCSPNNPTSTSFTKEEIIPIIDEFLDSDFVVDETYLAFRSEFDAQSLSSEAAERDNLHVVHSFSKFFSTPGVRGGILISNKELVSQFARLQAPYTLAPLAEKVIPWLLEQEGFIESSRRLHAANRTGALALFKEELGHQFLFTPPDANFVFGRPAELGDQSPTSHLAEQEIVVRDGLDWGDDFEPYFRFCLKDTSETSRLIEALRSY